MQNAQSLFADFLKTTVSPKLREMGFTGSGQNYALKSESHWALLGFQKSVYGDSNHLKFTINLFVVSKTKWTEELKTRSYYPTKPTPNTHWAVGWNMRIGKIMPMAQDYWWEFDSSLDTQKVCYEVISAVRDFALPALQANMK